MNKSDAERIATVLQSIGYQKTTSEKEADLILVVACSVRQSAVDRIYGKVRQWKQLQNKKPLVTILTGCVTERDKQKLSDKFDIIFDIKDLNHLPKQLKQLQPLNLSDYFAIHPTYSSDFQAYIPISTGCNNFCAYCVVPYLRGPEISRPAQDILKEVEGLVNKGYKEITLLGQNVNSYQNPASKSAIRDFPTLLEKVAQIPGNFWIHFITSHPKDMSDKLINTVAQYEKICPYIHLPVQAGNNEILKKMNRRYTREHYLKLIAKIRNKIPNAAISTDIIVGFPGETNEQFNDSVQLFKEVKFDMAYIAQYSERPGTAAAKLKDDVPRIEKKKREKVLTEILKKTATNNNKKLLNQEVKVLVEKVKDNYAFGKNDTFKTVKFAMPQNLPQQKIVSDFIRVEIKKAGPWGLLGIYKKSRS